MIILGIETSCDDTGIAIYDSKKGIISEYTYNQKIHNSYGGTVPELASKNHLKNIIKLLMFTLKNKKILLKEINHISYTIGPGLKNSLFIGIIVSKILSFVLNVPSIPVNHLKAHITICFLFKKKIMFPFLILFVSGANTFFIEMKNLEIFNLLGQTLDDSIGETLDKIARKLKFIPPNGKSIEKNIIKKDRFKNYFDLKIRNKFKNLDFSFSGIKSSIIRKLNNVDKNIICKTTYNIQCILIRIILNKFLITIKNTKKYKYIILCGGVSANKELRLAIFNYCYLNNLIFYVCPIKYSTDNGGMISFNGFLNIKKNFFDKKQTISIKPNLIVY